MCIIAAKPRDVAMPSDEIISNMWANNSDGAGFMYAKDGNVYIEKGFMKLKQLKAALARVQETTDLTAAPVILHFRITTHGGTKPENCHPFPVTDSIGKLQKLNQRTSLGVAHNGIIHNLPRKGISDTMEYIASQLAPLSKAVPNFYLNPHLMELVKNATESKLAFLNGDGDIYTIGHFEEDGGIQYSNFTYGYQNSYRYWSGSTYNRETKKWETLDYGSDAFDDFPLGDYKNYKTTGSNLTVIPNRASSVNTFSMYLMWLEAADGDFVANEKGELFDVEDYLIDGSNRVYKYDYHKDCCVRMDGYKAYAADGMHVNYDFDKATQEYVLRSSTKPLPF